jgi:hypothetical protein
MRLEAKSAFMLELAQQVKTKFINAILVNCFEETCGAKLFYAVAK